MKPPIHLFGVDVHPYVLCLALAALLSLAFFSCLGKRENLRAHTVLVFAAFAVPLGLLCARLFYFLVNIAFLWPMYGWRFFLVGGLHDFAISGAILGALLAGFLTAKATRQPAWKLLDALAPAGALMIALARFSEYFTGFGEGAYVETAALHFFPLAVVNEYGEWYAAIFVLEGLFALIICALLLCLKFRRPGDCARMALLFWGMTQIFCESLRSDSIKWGFVRVQQVFAAVLCLCIFGYYLFLRFRAGMPWTALLWRVLAFLLCIGVCVGVEFALDKSNLPPVLSYGAMLLAIAGLGVLTLDAMRDTPKS